MYLLKSIWFIFLSSALNPPEKSKSFASKAPFNPKSVKIWHQGDESQPYFEEESYEVAKFCIFLVSYLA